MIDDYMLGTERKVNIRKKRYVFPQIIIMIALFFTFREVLLFLEIGEGETFKIATQMTLIFVGVVFSVISLSLLMSLTFIFDLECAITVMNYHDGEYVMGDSRLLVEDVDNIASNYPEPINGQFLNSDGFLVSKKFTLEVNDEVVKEKVHSVEDYFLDLDEYSRLVKKKMKKEYIAIMRERNIEMKKNRKKERIERMKNRRKMKNAMNEDN